jgi:hypothetical protein
VIVSLAFAQNRVIGWLLGGLLIAWLVQRAEKRAAAV